MLKEYIHKYKIGVLFIVVLCAGVFLQLFSFNKTFSKEENRALEKMPSISFETWMNGDFQASLDTYVNDHFFMRTSWMRNKTLIEKKIGVAKLQDIYLGEDNVLLQDFAAPTKEVVEKKATRIISFLEKYQDKEASFILAPNAISMYSELLPQGVVVDDQNETLKMFYELLGKNCDKVDVRDIFKQYKDQMYLYYKTDHHWTTQAAKFAFDAWIVTTSLDNKNIQYDKYIVNDSFQGTLGNKIAYYSEQDTIEMFVPKEEDTKCIVTYEGKEKATSLYVKENQFANDPYTFFMGGNHPLVEIATTASEDRRLLLFKDSYANCFIPFLLPYYSEITVVDPRYYYDDIDALMKEKDITDILFLYNMNTFFSDSSLEDLLGE